MVQMTLTSFSHTYVKIPKFPGREKVKVALHVCPKHTDADIHSDHSYLDTLGIPLNSTLTVELQVC